MADKRKVDPGKTPGSAEGGALLMDGRTSRSV